MATKQTNADPLTWEEPSTRQEVDLLISNCKELASIILSSDEYDVLRPAVPALALFRGGSSR